MATAEAITNPPSGYRYIVLTPSTMGGQARVDGTRIRVSDIVARRLEGLVPERIASQECYPSLSLAQVYSALAYYADHSDEIDGDLRSATELADRVARENPGFVRDLRGRAESE